MIIAGITYAVVKPWVSAAAKDGVSLKDSPWTQWYAALEAGETIGVAGCFLKSGKGRIRGVWVRPAFRGRGASTTLMAALEKYLVDSGACYIDQLAAAPQWWIDRGWTYRAPGQFGGAWVYKLV